MKLLAAFACTVLSLSFGANAFAQSSSQALTRADVRAQLAEALADGLVPTPKADYPPSAQAIARNREIYAIQHAGASDGSTNTAQAAQSGVPPASH
ncbi:DUF4148 domain-containing protein [Paraburkholderia xenovorans]|uniref:DUF4148 domain-containing protein n=1 Tax=Paraburkholderia xenovorans TaxID=36873 RepID=UPI0038BB478C